ncbi:zf-HC2 domain-containing protein, partial [Gemmatimonadota bacterium]
MQMNDRCAEFRERLPLMLSGGLSEQEKAGLVLHLADCAECSDYLERLEADDLLLSLLVSRLEDSVGRVEEGVLALIRKEIEPARPPGAIIESRRDTERSGPPGAIIERLPKRWPRYAAAAAVILGALLIWSPFGRSPLVPVAWAEVIQRVADARNYICRVRSDIYLPDSP